MKLAMTLLGFVRWPLPRLLVLILGGGFAGLMVDIRVEHVEVVHDHSIAWLPIVYSGLMFLVCTSAALVWNGMARRILLACFSVAFAVGGLGFYFHNHGHVTRFILTSIAAWTDPKMELSAGPPQSAPMAFAGLGLIGILASLKRFNPQPLEAASPLQDPADGMQWKAHYDRRAVKEVW